jgi:hypothetical protein
MERCLSVDLPEMSYKQLETLALTSKTRVEDELVEAIRVYIAYRKNYLDDSFFRLCKSGKSNIGNLSEAHDAYLYGHMVDK